TYSLMSLLTALTTSMTSSSGVSANYSFLITSSNIVTLISNKSTGFTITNNGTSPLAQLLGFTPGTYSPAATNWTAIQPPQSPSTLSVVFFNLDIPSLPYDTIQRVNPIFPYKFPVPIFSGSQPSLVGYTAIDLNPAWRIDFPSPVSVNSSQFITISLLDGAGNNIVFPAGTTQTWSLNLLILYEVPK